VDAAVRDLVRIGLDDIVAYATPEMIDRYRDAGGELAQIPELSIDDVTTLSKRDDVLVFDVRNATEHEAARVPGSFNIAHTRLWVRRDEVPAGKTLAVHCMTGGRSAASASLLKRLGHDVVFLKGDFSVWASRNEVASGAPAIANA
jgi:hydroxyacylglutathione hydrolase